MKSNTASEIALRALAIAKNNDPAKAIELYRQSLELDEGQPSWVYAGLGNQLLRNNQADDAEPVFLAACEKYPEQPHGFVGLAMVSQRHRRWEQALERWNTCLERFPQQGQAKWYAKKAEALKELGRFEDSRIVFEKLCVEYPEDKHGWVGMAQLAESVQDWKSALNYWSEVSARFQDEINASIQKGNILINLEHYKEAEEVFAWARGKWPESIEPIKKLVKLALSTKDYSLALSRFDALLDMSPDNVLASFQRANLLAKYGNFEVAIKLVSDFLNSESSVTLTTDVFPEIFSVIQLLPNDINKTEYLKKLRSKVDRLSQLDGNEKDQLITAEISLALRDYDKLNESVLALNKRCANSGCLKSLSKLLDKYHSPEYPDFLSPKLFGIGLSKTATSSLNDALNILGFHSIHWTNPHTRGVISQDDFFLFDAFTDISVSFQFEVLYHTFPNSLFIYTTRSLDSWARSITSHYSNHHGISKPKDLRSQAIKMRLNGLPGWAEMNLYAMHDSWEEAYIHYDNRVRGFFQDKPPDRFLELRICDGEEWDNLCRFLGKMIPETRFPTQNRSHFTIQ